MRRVVFAVTLLLGSPAHAEGLDLPDGSHWQLVGSDLVRHGMSASVRTYNVGVGCRDGIHPGNLATSPAYLPPSFALATEEPSGSGGTLMRACADVHGSVVVISVTWSATPPPEDQTSLRNLLEALAGAFGRSVKPQPPLLLFKPSIASVPLDASTGAWDYLTSATTDTDTIVLMPLLLGATRVARPGDI